MSTNLGTYLTNKLLAWLGGGTFPAAPAAVYAALYNGDPLAAGAEVTTTVRAGGRVAVPLEAVSNGTDLNVASNGDADFGVAAANASVTHVALYDAQAGGNLLLTKSLGGTVAVTAGQDVVITSGDLTISGTPTSA